MERLLDELLSLILDKIKDPIDRKSFSQVCKSWFRVEGLHRPSLRVLDADLIPNFLPRFPNLLKFRASTRINSSLIQFVATTCPRIQVLNLNRKETDDLYTELEEEADLDDEGLLGIASRCRDLETVFLRKRIAIGDSGISALLGYSKNLRSLDLGLCSRVSDEGIKRIGDLKHLEALSLQGCWLITDSGLASLGEGSLCGTLKKLILAECDRITDEGLMCLKGMVCLEELNLSECGPNVTDVGMSILATFSSLKVLNLSWLVSVSSVGVRALAKGCQNMEVLDISGCEMVTSCAVRAFAGHACLRELVWTNYEFAIMDDDLEILVFGCQSLERIVLDKRFIIWITTGTQESISSQNCRLEFC
ncbi:F-box/LRR-repeat protein 7 [Striga asiatica]|uniref:F-box/LRR-repeat protein 7 n=1 Tax=Striga asiatica TaxID=4170 RepID=A0A5A7NYM0_STRAF|nr:F-box/LRR-repeat protein 7 [Striga asiatica]